MPFDVYENGQIVFTQNPVAFDAPIGTVVGTISVINATPTYKLSVGKNPYFAISGNNLISKAALVGGVDFVQIFAIKGFKRIAAVARIVVSGSATPIPPTPSGEFSLSLNLSGLQNGSAVPSIAMMSYWVNLGCGPFRLPIPWPQSTAFGALTSGVMTNVSQALANAASVGAKLIIDVHAFGNSPYGKVGSATCSVAAFVDMEMKLAAYLQADANHAAVHGIDAMNEWAGMDPADETISSDAASQAIILQASHDLMFGLRNAGNNVRLYLEWDHFSGAWDAIANSVIQLIDLILSDPARNSVLSLHCYPDHDNSGSHFVLATEEAAFGLAPPGLSTNVNIIQQRMIAVAQLAASKGVAIHWGEGAWSTDAPVLSSGETGNDDSAGWNLLGRAALTFAQANNFEVTLWGEGDFGPTYGYNPSPTNVISPNTKDFTSAGLQGTQTVVIRDFTSDKNLTPQPTAYRVDAPFGVVPYAPSGTAIPGFKARYNGKITAPKSFTPSAKLPDLTDAGGTFLPNPITMLPGDNGLAPFSYTPAGTFAAITIALHSTSGLVDPPGVGCSSATDFFTTVGSIASNVYATRRMVNSYAGPAFRLQRASDGAQMDFFFNNRGDLPRQAIQDWANGRLISIIIWYDQSGNANHAVFGANQIALLLVDTDGYPSVLWLVRASASVNSPSIGATATTVYADVSTSAGDIATQDNFAATFRLGLGGFSVDDNGGPATGNTVAFTGASPNVWEELAGTYSSLYATNNQKAYLNGSMVSQASVAQFANNSASNAYNIGDFRFGDQHFIGSMRTQITHYIEYISTLMTALSTARTAYFSTSLPDSLSNVNPTIAGTGARGVIAGRTSTPFFGVTISDDNTGSPVDSVIITLTGTAGGTLAGTGLSGSGPYTMSADTAANITANLQTVVYTPVGAASTSETLSLMITSSAGTSATDATTIVSVIAVAPAETPFAAPGGTWTPIGNYCGVNLRGAESTPPSPQFDHAYPINMEIDHVAAIGLGLIRMPINNRRLQPQSYGPLDPVYPNTSRGEASAYESLTLGVDQFNLLAIKRVLDHAFSLGIYVIIDSRGNGGGIWDTFNSNVDVFVQSAEGLAQYTDWWVRVATKFKNYPNVIWGLTNEPFQSTAAQWRTGAEAIVNAIAAVTTTQLILIPTGGSFDAMEGFATGQPGALAWTGYVPPAGITFMFEGHAYLDDNSGSHPWVTSGRGVACLTGACDWARANSFHLFLGEMGWTSSTTVVAGGTGIPMTEGAAAFAFMKANNDVFKGFSYWDGGTLRFEGGYMFNVVATGYPGSFNTTTVAPGPLTDKPQMAILLANIL